MKYGNFTTFDCPTKYIDEAYSWLDNELEKITDNLDSNDTEISNICYVVKQMNAHDSGSYPSFEIFMPEEYQYIDDDCNDKKLIEDANECLKALNDLEKRYYKKFSKWLR